jgi:hypothetical protein
MATKRKRRAIRRTIRSQTSQRGATKKSPSTYLKTERRNRAIRRASSPEGIRARTRRVSSAVQSQSNVSPWKGPRRVDITDAHRAAHRAVTGAVRSGVQATSRNLATHGRQISKNVSQAASSYRRSAARGRRAFVRKTGFDIRW